MKAGQNINLIYESGALNGWNLSNIAGASNWTASTTNPYQGSYHVQSRPLSTTQPASILVRNIATISYQNITLSYVRRLVGIDAADEFNATWYNGTTWFVLENTGGGSANDAGYINRSYNLSYSASNNPNFKIRFECTAGAVSEYCRIDNINISASSSPTGFYKYVFDTSGLLNDTYAYTIYASDTSNNQPVPEGGDFTIIL